jgi:putative nucleotidyltransferase with HDIG domain
MKKSKLPTRQQCFEMIKEYHVPQRVIKHSLTVAKLAVFLGERLKEKSIPLDLELLDRAALLHDIARVCDFDRLDTNKFEQTITEDDKAKWAGIRAKYKKIGHENAAYEILKEKYPKLAVTIKKHRYMNMLDEKTRPAAWEEKLLYYADMRVMHDRIVPLEKRLKDGHKRNVHFHGTEAQSKINTAKVDPLIYRLEKEIFEKIGLNPLEIDDRFIDSYSNNKQNKN